MNCRDMLSTPVCLMRADGSTVSALAFHELGLSAGQVVLNASTRFTDATGEVVYDPADFESIAVGECSSALTCAESQEWTYGLDNRGTRYNDTALHEIELSDGTKLFFEQTPTANWSAQLTQWAANIQAAADAKGLVWFVEPRFVDNSNPTNIDGTINGPGGTPSGLPGAPSETLAVALIEGGMAWRYVNFQICPGQPVPTIARRIESELYSVPYVLNTTTAILGPLTKFWVCNTCGQGLSWYLADGETLATEGQIPKCWEPCGTLALTEPPPDRACEFFFQSACDDQNDPDPTSWIQDITRRTTVCNGETIAVDYLSPDPADPSALQPYDIVGNFVDCGSGIPVEEPVPTCRDYEHVGLLWKFRTQGEIGTRVEYWKDNAAPHAAPADIFTQGPDGRYVHPNGAAQAEYVSPTFSVATSGAPFIAGIGAASRDDTNGLDQLKLSGYVNLPRTALVSDTNGNTGERGLFAIQYCCEGPLVSIAERRSDSVGGDTGIFTNVELPPGIHYVEIMTSDVSAWQGLAFSLSLDGGATFEPFVSSTLKPYYECLPVLKCLDSGVLVHAETGAPITVEVNDSWCQPECLAPATEQSTGSSGDGPTAEEIAAAMVTEERDRTRGNMVFFYNDNATQSLPVAPGTRGCLKTINDFGTGAVYWTVDGSTPNNGASSTMSVQYGNYIELCGIDLSLLRFRGSSGASDYSVTYEEWL